MGTVRPPRREARVPARLRRVLLRGLSADPARRFPDMNALLSALQRRRTPALRRRIAVGIAPVVLLAFGAGIRFASSRSPMRDGGDRLIAVLPFATSGSGREEAFYANAFHEQLIRQISKIGDLQVITRASVLGYRSGSTPLDEVREALGVASVVEGSVRGAGTRLHVSARLRDTRTGRELWSGEYEREIVDQFAIQAAIAEGVARTLNVWLTPLEGMQLARRPTPNAEAYDLYLHALEYFDQPDNQATLEPIVERLCRRAVQLDPKFALAYVCISNALINQFWWINGTPDSVAEEAKALAEEALRLEPDLFDGHFAIGLYYYWGRRDYPNALKEFERSGKAYMATPALAITPFWTSAALRRQGRFDEAIRRQQEAVRLDPRTPWLTKELGLSFAYTRRYEEADRILDRALALEPALTSAALLKAFVLEAWKGDAAYAKKVLLDLRGNIEAQGRVGGWDYLGDLIQHNPREGLALLESLKAPWIICFDAAFPKSFLAAVAHEALGEAALARKEYEEAVPLIEARVDDRPANARERAVLAEAYAALGRKADALREAERAVETLPIAKDALLGADIAVDRALVEARVGSTDAAIEHIRQLLSIPSLLSPAMLRFDPRWSPLRNDARFRQLAGLDTAQTRVAQP
jgi:serine/threonine-protein kinase